MKENRKFILKKNQRKILASAKSRSDYIRNRYYTILQRILRHDLFAPNVNENIKTSDNTSRKFVLKYAENLLSASTVTEVVMLGLLSKFKEGKFYLEDPSGAIPIDLSEAKFHSGLYTEGAYMLAEGTYNDGVLKVSGLGFPPPEAASSSRAYFGTLNYWGGPSQTLLKYSKRLLEFERLNFGGTIIFLSDCWLDDSTVLEKLKKLFLGFDDSPPIAIVMMGPFQKNKEEGISALRSKFAQLGEIIDSTFTLKNETDIVLVPDIEDPISSNILPRPPLPATVVQDLMRKSKRVILASNPCRLQYCTQQIVVCRMDLLRKMCRNTIKFPDNGQLSDHVSCFVCSRFFYSI
jgi:DNA polymerase epsilon subunit 2